MPRQRVDDGTVTDSVDSYNAVPMNGWRVMTNLSKQWNNKNRGALCRNAPTCANCRFQRGLTFALMQTNVLSC